MSNLNSSIEKWRGYAWDLPSGTIVEKKYKESELSLRRLLYARVLSQLDKRPSYPDSSYACDLSALWDVRYCGKGYGLNRRCENDHGFFTPLGCGKSWCLRCSGLLAEMRTSRIHNDIRTMTDILADHTRRRVPIVRVVLTLSPNCKESIIQGGRKGANEMIKQARKVMVRAANSDGTMPMMVTFHPTSSSRPWIKSPHIEVFAIWCDVGDTSATPLSWSNNGPIDVDKLRDEWTGVYPGSVQFDAHFFQYNPEKRCYLRDNQTLRSALRYALRPFEDDVFWATSEGTLGIPGGKMSELLNPWRPPTLRGKGESDPKVIVEGLQGEGGVRLWKSWHRVRRYGTLSSRGFRTRIESLYRSIGKIPPDEVHLCECPECNKTLRVVTYEDDDGNVRVDLLHSYEADGLGMGLLPGSGRAKSQEVLV